MKLGVLTAIFDGMSLEEVVDFASEHGLECLEVACWPVSGGAKRRYAGVSHIDVAKLDRSQADHICRYCADKGVVISSLCYYPKNMDTEVEKIKRYIKKMYH